PAGLLALLYGALDVVLWHVLGARRGHCGPEPRVHGGVRQAQLCSRGDFAAELGEKLGAFLVLGAFAELDVLEFRMASHRKSFWLPALRIWCRLYGRFGAKSIGAGSQSPLCRSVSEALTLTIRQETFGPFSLLKGAVMSGTTTESATGAERTPTL